MNERLPRRIQSAAGFNLIEVSLAIAICSIGLIALMGLIPTGTEASRRAADDTLAAALASDVLHWRHVSPYTTNTFFPGGATPLNARPAIPTNVTMILDAMGNFAVHENGSINTFYTGPYFQVDYMARDHPQFIGNPDIARVVVTVEWPYNAAGANRTRRTFVSNFTRMQ